MSSGENGTSATGRRGRSSSRTRQESDARMSIDDADAAGPSRRTRSRQAPGSPDVRDASSSCSKTKESPVGGSSTARRRRAPEPAEPSESIPNVGTDASESQDATSGRSSRRQKLSTDAEADAEDASMADAASAPESSTSTQKKREARSRGLGRLLGRRNNGLSSSSARTTTTPETAPPAGPSTGAGADASTSAEASGSRVTSPDPLAEDRARAVDTIASLLGSSAVRRASRSDRATPPQQQAPQRSTAPTAGAPGAAPGSIHDGPHLVIPLPQSAGAGPGGPRLGLSIPIPPVAQGALPIAGLPIGAMQAGGNAPSPQPPQQGNATAPAETQPRQHAHDPNRLRGLVDDLLRPLMGRQPAPPRAPRSDADQTGANGAGPAAGAGTTGTTGIQPPAERFGGGVHAGTYVVVQGMLLARGLASGPRDSGDSDAAASTSQATPSTSNPARRPGPSVRTRRHSHGNVGGPRHGRTGSARTDAASAHDDGVQPTHMQGRVTGDLPPTGTSEQSAMLTRMISIATAATALSLMDGSAQGRDAAAAPGGPAGTPRANGLQAARNTLADSRASLFRERGTTSGADEGEAAPAAGAQPAAESSTQPAAESSTAEPAATTGRPRNGSGLAAALSRLANRLVYPFGRRDDGEGQAQEASPVAAAAAAPSTAAAPQDQNEAGGPGNDTAATLPSLLSGVFAAPRGSSEHVFTPMQSSGGSSSSTGANVPSWTHQTLSETLSRVRSGTVADGPVHTFDHWLFGLTQDLQVAIENAHGTQQPDPNDEAIERRRFHDVQQGNLSFFRIFRFGDGPAPAPTASQTTTAPASGAQPQSSTGYSGASAEQDTAAAPLQPCVVVGIRSRPIDQAAAAAFGMPPTDPPQGSGPAAGTASTGNPSTQPPSSGTGASGPTPASAAQAEEQPIRYSMFISGGYYAPSHPLLTTPVQTAASDLMHFMETLAAITALQQSTRNVTSQQELRDSNLQIIKFADLSAHVARGEVTSNTAERCLICLEDWKVSRSRRDDHVRRISSDTAHHRRKTRSGFSHASTLTTRVAWTRGSRLLPTHALCADSRQSNRRVHPPLLIQQQPLHPAALSHRIIHNHHHCSPIIHTVSWRLP